MTPPATTLRARVVSYALGAYKVFYRKCCRRNFKKDSFDWELKGLVPFLIVESDWRATSLLPYAHNSPKHIQSKFWDSHFVQRSWKFWKLGLWGWQPPTVLRVRVVSYALGAYKVFIESVVVKTSKKLSFDWKFKGLVIFKSWKWPPPHLFPKHIQSK